MTHTFVSKVWTAFGNLLSLQPTDSSWQLAKTAKKLATRSDRDMLAADFARVGQHIQQAMQRYRNER